tara:strand:+ start:239 stop:436 length:198 start_codon:yes stop_codon:yes gene_type:complete
MYRLYLLFQSLLVAVVQQVVATALAEQVAHLHLELIVLRLVVAVAMPQTLMVVVAELSEKVAVAT